MGLLLIGLTALTTLCLLGIGIAALVDTQRRRREQQDFLTGPIRRAVNHTASLPVRSLSHQLGLRFTTSPILGLRTRRLFEDSGL